MNTVTSTSASAQIDETPRTSPALNPRFAHEDPRYLRPMAAAQKNHISKESHLTLALYALRDRHDWTVAGGPSRAKLPRLVAMIDTGGIRC